MLFISGGLFKIYIERRARQSADYVIVSDADFGPAHLQNSILPDTVCLYHLICFFDILLLVFNL